MSHHPYGYVISTNRQCPGAQGTSSAFCSSANPDEDWTKISDLAERRRIQNRIAQRNYRKKLKKRLEELERRASDGSPIADPQPSANSSKSSKRTATTKSLKAVHSPKALLSQPQAASSLHSNDGLILTPSYDDRGRSHTPPLFGYSIYPSPDELLLAPFAPSQSYIPITSTEAYPNYLTGALAPTLPPVSHFGEELKRSQFTGGEGMHPYVGYSFIPNMGVASPPPYESSNPHTPPLSQSFDHSANCSESGYDYPTTPLSLPGSPGMIHSV